MKISSVGDYLIIKQDNGRYDLPVDVSKVSNPSPDKDWLNDEIKKNKLWYKLLMWLKIN